MWKIKSIAVLISTYNGEKYIKEQLKSLYKQKGDFDIYIYIRDDGSSDNTVNIIEEYGVLFDHFKFLKDRQHNLGPARSFLLLLKQTSKHDFYFFCDQDDVWCDYKIQRAISKLQKIEKKECLKPKLYFSNATIVDKVLKPIGKVYKSRPNYDFYSSLLLGGALGCTMCFDNNLACIIKEERLPSKIIMHDFYTLSLCSLLNGIIIYDEKETLKYRQHGENSIGVNYTFLNKVYRNIKDIFTPVNCTVSEQLKSIICLYKNSFKLNNAQKSWLILLTNLNKKITNKMKFMLLDKAKYRNISNKIVTHLSILMGNY